jgi:hypothetical protein
MEEHSDIKQNCETARRFIPRNFVQEEQEKIKKDKSSAAGRSLTRSGEVNSYRGMMVHFTGDANMHPAHGPFDASKHPMFKFVPQCGVLK